MRFLDTNILLYSISRTEAENKKREIAIAMLDQDDWTISVHFCPARFSTENG